MTEERRGKVIRIEDVLPDVRDGLTRVERVILYELYKTQKEMNDRNVPSAMLYGRVVEHDGIDLTPEQFQRILARLGGMRVR